jgi:hypothetical protein
LPKKPRVENLVTVPLRRMPTRIQDYVTEFVFQG